MKSFQKHMNHFIGFYLLFNLTCIIIPGGRQGWNHSILFVVNGRRFGAAGWGEAMCNKWYSENPGGLTTHVLFFPTVDRIPPCASPQSHTQTPPGLDVLPNWEFVEFLKGKKYIMHFITPSAPLYKFKSVCYLHPSSENIWSFQTGLFRVTIGM